MPEPIQTPDAFSRLAQAYLNVFGISESRTSDQKLVYDDLESKSRFNAPVFVQNADGSFDTHRAAHIDGARTLFMTIPNQIRLAVDKKLEKKAVR
jgi:lantibiotic modifying enzyme